MINLLPDERQAAIRAARTNVVLLRYTVILVLAIGFLLGSAYFTNRVLTATKDSADAQIAASDTKADIYRDTQVQVESLASSLGQTKSTLDQEIRYSKVLTDIAALMPAGTLMDSVSLGESAFNGGQTSFKIYAKSTADAVALQEKFQASRLFNSVSFQKIGESDTTVTGYPVSVTMTVSMNKAGI